MKPKKLKCRYCGTEFITSKAARKFCSVQCRMRMYNQNNNSKKQHIKKTKKGQLCWDCANACSGCSWSRNFTPVQGWIAESTTIVFKHPNGNEHETKTYKIIECPEYRKG